MKDKDRDGRLDEGRRPLKEWTSNTEARGQSQDLRDVTARIRAIELFNPDGLLPPVPFVSHPRFSPAWLFRRLSYVGPHLLRRPRILRPACYLYPSRPLASISLFSVAAYFFCLASHALTRGGRGGRGALSLSSSAATPACLPSPFSLLSRRPCSRAVPLYLPPPSPVVPSSLKAVESNQ